MRSEYDPWRRCCQEYCTTAESTICAISSANAAFGQYPSQQKLRLAFSKSIFFIYSLLLYFRMYDMSSDIIPAKAEVVTTIGVCPQAQQFAFDARTSKTSLRLLIITVCEVPQNLSEHHPPPTRCESNGRHPTPPP